MYFVNGIPFTFDDIDDMGSIEFSMETANSNESYTLDDIYKGSSYLMAEEAHPCLFDVKVDNNFSQLIIDMKINLWYSKSMGQWRWTLVEEWQNGVSHVEQHSIKLT